MNCLDAETLAAWFDGGLSGAALEGVRTHVAGCARCQALVGTMGRTRAAVPVPEPERSPRWWLAWAVPAAAVATAVAIWVAVPKPPNGGVTSPPSPSLRKQEAQPQSTPPPAAPAQAETAAPPERRATPTLQNRTPAADAAPQPAAAPEAANDAAQQTPSALQETITVQSAPAASAPGAAERRERTERQGAVAGQLQTRTAIAANPCGPSWPAPPSDVAGQITAGSAPSADVCWIVGRAGIVLRSTDHQTWQRTSVPQSGDLSGIAAADARTATVVAANGRTFSTSDGGVSWTQP